MTNPPPSTVAAMRDVLTDLDASRPRSQQTALGPSELGTPCQRQIAMKLAGLARQLPDKRPPWAPMQGTAIHALMEQALNHHNQQLGRIRWIIEQTLHIDDEITGHGDAYDLDHDMVIDWKHVGSTALKKARRKTVPIHELVSPTYRIQAHLYGYGHARAGRGVKWVRLVLLARSHDYDQSAEWTEAYNPDIAIWAMDRYYATQDLIKALPLTAQPHLWAVVPSAPSEDTCAWCPFRRPGGPADATGCPGNTTDKIDKQVKGLIVAEQRCAVTDLVAAQCAHCRKTADPPTPRPGPWFVATYPGSCSQCGHSFDMFDRIRADGEHGYLAECCANPL